ncbi:hypothetical protein IFM89_013804 [Coptis chinensis]|uniref:RRM domain-containing protein n=1 Tax=Coptis chinensis TaxID=261450 RepID=A0A835HMC0_9MAGN|nr:hypothetical protein IFM89_013804 [Coptis chinensis]
MEEDRLMKERHAAILKEPLFSIHQLVTGNVGHVEGDHVPETLNVVHQTYSVNVDVFDSFEDDDILAVQVYVQQSYYHDVAVVGVRTDAEKSLESAFAPAIGSGLPWVAILGNHDQESTLSREGVMKHIVIMNDTLARLNPLEAQVIDGFGNYNLEVGGVEDVEYHCFVCGLAWTTNVFSLVKAFSVYGDILECKIISDREIGRSRGFGFVTFSSEQAMRETIEDMNG